MISLSPKAFGLSRGTALPCMPRYLRITRSTPLSGDMRLLGPRVAVRSRSDNYLSKAGNNDSISRHTRRSEALLKLSCPVGSPTDGGTLTCVICHTNPLGCFTALCPVNRYKTSYRSVIDVICRKIEADDTGVTTLAEAICHAVLTHSCGSDGRQIYAETIARRPNTAIYRCINCVFLMAILAIFGHSGHPGPPPTRPRSRPSPARLPDL